ncbi:MAG: hypothetical protein EBQ92_12430 [Proteobacteria bacterium]|nr:hypothetical protein [Pseudomonadota bacterium]
MPNSKTVLAMYGTQPKPVAAIAPPEKPVRTHKTIPALFGIPSWRVAEIPALSIAPVVPLKTALVFSTMNL